MNTQQQGAFRVRPGEEPELAIGLNEEDSTVLVEASLISSHHQSGVHLSGEEVHRLQQVDNQVRNAPLADVIFPEQDHEAAIGNPIGIGGQDGNGGRVEKGPGRRMATCVTIGAVILALVLAIAIPVGFNSKSSNQPVPEGTTTQPPTSTSPPTQPPTTLPPIRSPTKAPSMLPTRPPTPFPTLPPPPENDSCEGAIAINLTKVEFESLSGFISGTTTNANSNFTCGSTSPDPGVWYSIDREAHGFHSFSADACEADFDSRVSIYGVTIAGGFCGQPTCMTASSTSGSNGDSCRVSITNVANVVGFNDFLVLVHSSGRSETGDFELVIRASTLD